MIVAVCDKIRRKSTRVCIGSLNHKVKIFTRTLTPPSGSSVDFLENFVEDKIVWGMIDTVTGVAEFDETNVEMAVITHDVYIRYIPSITFEKWLTIEIGRKQENVFPMIWPFKFGSTPIDKRLRIIRVQNYQENNKFYRLRCTVRGIDTLPVNEV